jgi:hypothetical protein
VHKAVDGKQRKIVHDMLPQRLSLSLVGASRRKVHGGGLAHTNGPFSQAPPAMQARRPVRAGAVEISQVLNTQTTCCTVADREIAETPIASRIGPRIGHSYRLADRFCL